MVINRCHKCAIEMVAALVAFLPVFSASAADPDITGLVPTIWWDFETKPDAADPGFADFENGDYSLAKGSPLVGKGADYAEAGGLSEFDLSCRRSRVVSSRVDIGCYEEPAKGMFIFVR